MMTNKIKSSLKVGQRYHYTEGRRVDMLVEIKKILGYYNNEIVGARILSIKKGQDDYSVGITDLYTDTGTWTYLQGQDKPKGKK